jgi:hypothetical protein
MFIVQATECHFVGGKVRQADQAVIILGGKRLRLDCLTPLKKYHTQSLLSLFHTCSLTGSFLLTKRAPTKHDNIEIYCLLEWNDNTKCLQLIILIWAKKHYLY